MARARYFEVATDTLGRPVPGTVVNVYQPGTTTPITETIYAADTGGTTLTNPLTANAQGEIEFYLDAPKRVDLRWVKAGYTTESHAADVGSADLYATDAELIGTYVAISGNPNSGTPKLYIGPDPSLPLDQIIVKSDDIPVAGRPDLSTFEFEHDGSAAYILHLVAGPNMGDRNSGAALIGLGLDNGGTGLFVNNYTDGVGIKVTQRDTITEATAYGLLINAGLGSAPGAMFFQNTTGYVNGPAAAVFFAYASTSASQRLVEFRRPSVSTPTTGELIGYVDSTTGRLVWQSQIYTQPDAVGIVPLQVTGLTGQTVDLQRWDVAGSGTLAKIDKFGGATFNNTLNAPAAVIAAASASIHLHNSSSTSGQRYFKWTIGTGNLVLSAMNDAGGGGVDILYIKHTNGDITPKDGATIVGGATTGLKIGNATSKLGFFNAAPIAKPTGVAVDAAGIHAALVSLGLIGA